MRGGFMSRKGNEMYKSTVVVLLFSICSMIPGFVSANDSHSDWWRDSLRDPYWESPCEFKLESKPGEFKREIKCRNGRGATWRGVWKEEFYDGRCKVKLEATREVFKEEVKCDHD
jgi:hypothetical protein